MSKVYLSVPLIANRDMNKARLLSRTIEEMGYEIVSKWVTAADPGYTLTPQEVFERDTKGVEECDILVAEVSQPSHGVGMEIMLAHTQGKRIVCMCTRLALVSYMIRGLPNVLLIEYASEKDIVEKLETFLGKTQHY